MELSFDFSAKTAKILKLRVKEKLVKTLKINKRVEFIVLPASVVCMDSKAARLRGPANQLNLSFGVGRIIS